MRAARFGPHAAGGLAGRTLNESFGSGLPRPGSHTIVQGTMRPGSLSTTVLSTLGAPPADPSR
jgi:hypothetical protein